MSARMGSGRLLRAWIAPAKRHQETLASCLEADLVVGLQSDVMASTAVDSLRTLARGLRTLDHQKDRSSGWNMLE